MDHTQSAILANLARKQLFVCALVTSHVHNQGEHSIHLDSGIAYLETASCGICLRPEDREEWFRCSPGERQR